ncbi:LysR substrate-binding domain-containing protein [Rosenbergiella epipactidis]|uniref:LysR substrate-binding domain-containing protein n=1 Tax=Rosenbergiella epipactidis TaxID=1544694 RepID=UPI001F4E983E|nr:LysR substrate-binding domain-containing protein [Rosenbergiella epipactidis]
MILEYMEDNSELNIELDLSDKFLDLTTDNIDIAIRVGEVPDSDDIIAKYLASYEFVACASPKYLKEFGTPSTPYYLFNHQCISFNKNILIQWQGNDFVNKMNRSRMVSFSIDAIRMNALSGMGVIIHSKIFVDDDIKKGTLLTILKDYPLPKRKVSAIYHKSKRNDDKIKNLLNFIQGKISKTLPL